MPRKLLFLLTLLIPYSAVSQTASRDSLSMKSYDWFISRLESDKNPPQSSAAYGAAYLAKAKREKDWRHMADAYKCLLHQAKKENRLIYADSMVWASRHTADDAEIGSAYLTEGIVYYDLKNHMQALDNYLKADSYISRTDDTYLKHKVRFNIAQIKYYLGFYNEGVALFKQCVEYFREEDAMAYLSSLHSLGLCYNRLGKYVQCSQINELGLSESSRLGHGKAAYRFTHSEGINSYCTKDYNGAIVRLKQVLPAMARAGDFANEAVANFYIGRSYWALSRHDEAIPFFLKADRVFADNNYIRPDLREGYELLIGYYRDKGDLPKQLLYIERLLKADKFIEANYKYLSGKIHKEYDTKKLLEAKSGIVTSLRLGRNVYRILAAALLTAVIVLGYSITRYKKQNRKKFEELMMQVNGGSLRKPVYKPVGDTGDISPDVVDAILKRLERFESAKRYLEPDMTLGKMAGIFHSNTKYISRVIQHHKGKKSIDYINDLKIEHVIDLLRSESKYRNYTNKALAEEAGFSTTQHFRRAFEARTGVSPAYFIEKLEQQA